MKRRIQQTSLQAYYDIKSSLGARQREILSFLEREYPETYTNNEIAVGVNLPINCVTPRVYELRKKGFVRAYGKRHCAVTGRLAIEWGLDFNREKQMSFF